MFGSWVLDEIWIMNLSSTLVDMLMSSSKIFLFSNKAHLNLGSYSHQACCLLYYLCASNFVIHIYQFTFDLFSECGCGFGFEQKHRPIDGFGEKEARIGGFVYPYLPPSVDFLFSSSLFRLVKFRVEVAALN